MITRGRLRTLPPGRLASRFSPVPVLLWLLVSSLLAAPQQLRGQEDAEQEERTWYEQRWGLGFTMRISNIPFATETKTVATLVPLIMYEGPRVYFRETEGGFKFIDNDRWRLSAMGRMHFFDIPAEFQNEIQGDRPDWGVQVRYRPWTRSWLDFELLSDLDGHSSTRVRVGTRWFPGRFRAEAFADAAYRTSHYNSFFWGLTQEKVDGGVDLTGGINAYYHLISSLYLQGAFVATYLSRPVRNASLVEDDLDWRAFVGIGISNDRFQSEGRQIETTPYWRLAHQWGTPSALADHPFQTEPDSMNSQLTTVFYGLPLTDRLFTLPLHVYLHSGLGLHWPSDYQDGSLELVVSIKVHYTIPLPWRIRVGFAEGVSVVSEVTALERANLEGNGFKPSEYLNYLEPSVGINIGDIFRSEPLKNLWLGYVIHHRSAIFETAQQFGRISGGSNWPGVYLTLAR